jgi:uncharacterized protein YjbJ (UPF0337 family)
MSILLLGPCNLPASLRVLYAAAKELIMDREHIKGAADKAKGAIKEAAGKVTGSEKLEAEGKLDKAKGAAHNVAGDAKDAARDVADRTRSR